MRIGHLLCLLVLAAVSYAQDTNFAVGPQYLITSDSTLLLRPIVTPTLSLGESLPPIRDASTEQAAVPATSSEPVGLSSQEFFAGVYWGEHTPGEVTGRLITTPSLSLSEQSATPSAAATGGPPAREMQSQAVREESATRIFDQRTSPSSSSVVQVGVTATADVPSLREQGYGVLLAEAALSAKTKPHATRVFTNRDIERLHADSR